jgi:hypothetical protein
MSTQPLEAVVATTRGVLANVTADQMQNASPCASWDVAGIINHLIGGQGFFVAGMTGTPPSGEEVDDAAGDFLAAYDEATQASSRAPTARATPISSQRSSVATSLEPWRY